MALTAISVVAIAAAGGGFDHRHGASLVDTTCRSPNLAGSVVDVTLVNMGGPMMMNRDASIIGGMMRLTADRSTVPHGVVSFLAVNAGTVNHELVVLPLAGAQIVGTRVVGGDGKIDEAGSLGEASHTCGAGSGDGIAPGASSWVTLTLQPGRYELVCNLPGHYAAGMYTQITVD
ncbi:MAG TPA: sulfocyanin-like copper-binding protein [Acidimicrobiia bacterium]